MTAIGILAVLVIVLLVIDCLQTRHFANPSQRHRESNPVLRYWLMPQFGASGVYAYFTFWIVVTILLARSRWEYALPALAVLLAVQFAAVMNNTIKGDKP